MFISLHDHNLTSAFPLHTLSPPQLPKRIRQGPLQETLNKGFPLAPAVAVSVTESRNMRERVDNLHLPSPSPRGSTCLHGRGDSCSKQSPYPSNVGTQTSWRKDGWMKRKREGGKGRTEERRLRQRRFSKAQFASSVFSSKVMCDHEREFVDA